ncbi:MAG: zinc ribbon domain-containing protein [Clostridia bacterium]|nr:zinc ribbon domain-containing protein [Clostridia bacterium]
MYCKKCGTEILNDSVFCNRCGNKIEQTSTKTLNENNVEQDEICAKEKKQKNKTKSSNKKKTIIWIICSILLTGIFLSIYIINDIHQTAEQDQMNELRSNIVKQYNTLGISKTVQDYMNMSKDELQKELDRVSKQVEEFIELNTKYESIIANVDYIDYKFKLGDMGYQKINNSTGSAVVVIPKKVVKTDKIFHINTLTDKVDTIWCIVEFSYDYTDGIKLRAGTNTLVGNLKINVETENVTVYSPLDFDNGVVTYSDLYMPAENHIIAMKNTAHNYVIYPYKFYTRETVQMLFGNQLPENNQANNKTNEDNKNIDETNLDSNINNTASNSSNPINETSNYNTALSEIKKCLKDVNWLKQNIYITEDEMISNNTDISDQQINFIVCKSNTKPIIVVKTSSDNNLSIKIDLVTYENNKVKVERIGEGHNSHVGYYIDANKCVVRTEYMHMGTCKTLLHSIVDGKINLLGSYGYYEENISNTDDNVESKYTYCIGFDTNFNNDKVISENEYEIYKKNLNEEQYNFVVIATELTSENIDLYINGY